MPSNEDIARQLIIQSFDASHLAIELANELNIENHLTCWHFTQVNDEKEKDFRAALKNLDHKLLGGSNLEAYHSSLEIWDRRLPEVSWLKERLPQITQITDHLGVLIEGWSYEPIEREGRDIPQAFFLSGEVAE